MDRNLLQFILNNKQDPSVPRPQNTQIFSDPWNASKQEQQQQHSFLGSPVPQPLYSRPPTNFDPYALDTEYLKDPTHFHDWDTQTLYPDLLNRQPKTSSTPLSRVPQGFKGPAIRKGIGEGHILPTPHQRLNMGCLEARTYHKT